MSGALLSHPIDVYYFSATRQNALLWVPAAGEAVLVVRAVEDGLDLEALGTAPGLAAAVGAATRAGSQIQSVSMRWASAWSTFIGASVAASGRSLSRARRRLWGKRRS